MKKWIKFIYGKYAKLRLDRKIAILYMLLILVLSVTLTVLITHTAGTILIRDRKNSVRRNVNVAKEFIETDQGTAYTYGSVSGTGRLFFQK